jgi:superfamily II DNA or RNA helicase
MTPRINGDTMECDFRSPWTPDLYRDFLKTKEIPEAEYVFDHESNAYTVRAPSRFASVFGVQPPDLHRDRLPFNEAMFDYQTWATGIALAAKRFGIFADCGLGKTFMKLEFARQVRHLTGKPVLIMEPKNVISQTIAEARRWYRSGLGAIARIETREQLATFCKSGKAMIGITNYEKMIPRKDEPEVFEPLRYLGGLILDESSILKTGGGTIKWAIIKSARGIEYKLSLTATPAPNDTMEYASQAGFLEKMRTENDILWTYFQRDKAGNWKVKPHARDAFYKFMSSWSLYLRDPERYGFTNNPVHAVPPPEIRTVDVPITAEQSQLSRQFFSAQTGELMITDRGLGVRERSKLSQLAKGFCYEGTGSDRKTVRVDSKKPAVIADLCAQHGPEQKLIWTVFDAESEILQREIPGSVVLSGSTPEDERDRILDLFCRGSINTLISKPSLLGYGLNFQHVSVMIFSGWDDSYERFYQALRRAWRFGQKKSLQVYVPVITELEGMILDNVLRKQALWEADTEACERAYAAALKGKEVAA